MIFVDLILECDRCGKEVRAKAPMIVRRLGELTEENDPLVVVNPNLPSGWRMEGDERLKCPEHCEIEMGEEERHGNRHAKRRKGN